MNHGRRRWTWLFLLIGAAAIGAAGGLVTNIYRAAQMLIQSEHQLHAWITASEVVQAYLLRSETREWPRSWDDLEEVAARKWNETPREYKDEVAALVEIDFAATVTEVARQTPETFTAMRPKGPMDEVYRVLHAQAVIDAAKKAASR